MSWQREERSMNAMLTTQVVYVPSSAFSFIWHNKKIHFSCFNSGLLPYAGNNHNQYVNNQISHFFSFFLVILCCLSLMLSIFFFYLTGLFWSLTWDLFICVLGMTHESFNILKALHSIAGMCTCALLSLLLYHSTTGMFCVYGLSIWFEFGVNTPTILKGEATCYHAKSQQTEYRITCFLFCVSTETCWTEIPSPNQTQVRCAFFFY